MGLIGRLKRRLGLSYRTWCEEDQDVYRYDVTHVDGSTTTVYGHAHKHDGAFLLVYEIPDDTWWYDSLVGLTPAWSYSSWKTVARLESIKSYEKTRVGIDKWKGIYDEADSQLDKVTKTNRVLEDVRNT